MIGIKAIGTYLPEVRTSNFDRMKKFGMTESFVKHKIGFTKVAIKAPEHETSDLCVKAWENLRKNHSVTPDDIDCVVVCTQIQMGKDCHIHQLFCMKNSHYHWIVQYLTFR